MFFQCCYHVLLGTVLNSTVLSTVTVVCNARCSVLVTRVCKLRFSVFPLLPVCKALLFSAVTMVHESCSWEEVSQIHTKCAKIREKLDLASLIDGEMV